MIDPVARLVVRLQHASPAVRVAAARALVGLGDTASSAAPALTVALTDSHWMVAVTAAEALGHMGSAVATSVPALCKALGHPDWNVRRAAAEALGNLPEVDTHSLKAIEERSRHDTSPEVRGACKAALHWSRARLARSAKAQVTPLLPPGPLKNLLS